MLYSLSRRIETAENK